MIDLHTHSVYSDGTNTPEELVDLAEKQGLKAIALTDHDTVAGVSELMAASKKRAIQAIPAIELSADCERGTMHILGYFVDHTHAAFLEILKGIQEDRHERNINILKKLNKLGHVLLWSDVKTEEVQHIVGRPHFAAALVKHNYVKTKKEAFERLLAKGRPAYIKHFHYSAQECFEFIRAAGGVPVLAHPATLHLPNDALFTLLQQMKEDGLAGIETYYAENNLKNRRTFSDWAKKLDLVCTGGSDFHGGNSPDLKIGVGFGKLHVPDKVLDQLDAVKP